MFSSRRNLAGLAFNGAKTALKDKAPSQANAMWVKNVIGNVEAGAYSECGQTHWQTLRVRTNGFQTNNRQALNYPSSMPVWVHIFTRTMPKAHRRLIAARQARSDELDRFQARRCCWIVWQSIRHCRSDRVDRMQMDVRLVSKRPRDAHPALRMLAGGSLVLQQVQSSLAMRLLNISFQHPKRRLPMFY
jgi:hypothetical protein